MNTTHIDTLQYTKRLKDAGFTDAQAETITALQDAAIDSVLEQARHDYRLDEIATMRDIKGLEIVFKHDIKELETSLKRDIEVLRADTGRLIAESRADLTRWIIGAGFLQTALIVGVLLKVAHLA